jgi:hypothetical protein
VGVECVGEGGLVRGVQVDRSNKVRKELIVKEKVQAGKRNGCVERDRGAVRMSALEIGEKRTE